MMHPPGRGISRSFLFWFAALLFTSAPAHAAEPQYQIDSSFRAPLFTSPATAPRILVLPDDRFYSFSHVSPPGSSAFQRLNGTRCGNLVRFLPDGTMDPSFVLDDELFGYTIHAVAVAPAGKLIVAAIPQYRSSDLTNRVVRLNEDGSLDRTFDAGAGAPPASTGQATIQAVAIDSLRRVIVAGQFTDFSGSGRGWLLRLNSDGSVDTSFESVRLSFDYLASVGILNNTALAVQSDRKVIFGGAFSHVNGTARPGVARLNEDGKLDSSFVPSGFDVSTYPGSYIKRPVHSVAVRPADGKVMIGGGFNPVRSGDWTGAVSFQMIVLLRPDGSADPDFNAARQGTSYICRALTVLESGDTIAVSDLMVTRFKPDGAFDTAFNANVPTSLSRLVNVSTQSGDRVIFAGNFRSIGADAYSGVGRLHEDGTRDVAFRPGELQREQLPVQTSAQTDGKIIVGGSFTRVDGAPRERLAVLEPGGSLSPRTYPSDVFSSAFFLQPDDKLLRWSYSIPSSSFTVGRFNSDSSADRTFTADPETIEFHEPKLQANGSYLLSTGSSPQAVANEVLLARMQPHGAKDPSFDLGIEEQLLVERYGPPTNLIYRMYSGDNRVLAVLPGDKILYKYFEHHGTYRIVRLDPNGAIDTSFQQATVVPRATEEGFPHIYDRQTRRTYQPAEGVLQPTSLGPCLVLPEPDGGMILAGQFTNYNGASAGSIVRLNADGSLNSILGSGAAFTTTPVTDWHEPSISELQRDYAGRILVVGDFESFHGVAAPGIARLNADGSLDTSFVPPVTRRATGVVFSDYSGLTREGAGRFLLTGNYAATAGSSTATSIFRMHIPVRASSVAKTSATGLTINFTGVPGETYKIEHAASMTSSAFVHTGSHVQAAPDGTFIYEDASAFSSLQRFYRAVSLE